MRQMDIRNNMPRLAVMASAAMMLLFGSCKGRTADNMEPSGQTVEVVISEPATADSTVNDTIAQIELSKDEN